jgi:hypothetical protein
MGHTDTERPDGIAPPVTMPMILDKRMAMQMHVLCTVMIVRMDMPAFPNQSDREHPSKKYEHHADSEFSRDRHGLRNRYTKHQHYCTGQE